MKILIPIEGAKHIQGATEEVLLRDAMERYDRASLLAYRNRKRGNLKRATMFTTQAAAIAAAVDRARGLRV